MTSVQMVITAFYQYRYDNPYLVELFDKAVKIHEQEIKDAYNQGFEDCLFETHKDTINLLQQDI